MRLKLAFIYALKDLRGAFLSFRIVLLCLFLGVATIASVQFVSRNVLDAITSEGRVILGADMILRYLNAPAPNEMREWLEARGATLSQSVESRVMLGDMKTDEAVLVELKGVDDAYPLFGVFEADTGHDLQVLLQNNGVLVDKALHDRLGLNIGDKARLGNGVFEVRGFIENEPDRAGGSRFGIAPRVVAHLQDLEGSGLLHASSMAGYDLRVALAHGVSLPDFRAELESFWGTQDFKITDSDNASPRLMEFVVRLMVFLTLVGLSALLIGGIGIGNGVRAYLETRVQTIAIFKILGAHNGFVELIYIIQLLLIGAIGTGLGVVAGSVAPFLMAPYLSAVLPFSVSAGIDLAGIVVPVLFGFLIMAGFALWPLGRAVGALALSLFRAQVGFESGGLKRRYKIAIWTVMLCLAGLAVGSARNTVFAMWFIGGALFCFCVFWCVGMGVAYVAGRVHLKAPVLRLALRNLHRPGNVTAGTLVSLGLGLSVLMSVTMIELNLRYGIEKNLPNDAPAFFFLDIQNSQKQAFEALLAEQETVENILFSPNLRGRIVAVNGVPAADALRDEKERWLLQNDRGFTYISELPAHSEILSGQWWQPDYKGEPLVSVVEDVVRAFGVGVGDEITVNILGRDITAKIANTRSVNWMNFTINFAISFAPGVLEGAPHSFLATAVADKRQEAEIQRNISKAFPNITMIRLSEAVEAAGAMMAQIASAVRVTAFVTLLSGVFVLAGSLAASRSARLYDTVILKVLGVRGRMLVRGFMIEFGLLGGLAGGISFALGSAISWAVMHYMMQIKWQFFTAPALLIGGAGVCLTLVIGWFSIGRVLGQSAAPYLRNE